jgi:diguanylate cyclase (GGDEF)-like protein
LILLNTFAALVIDEIELRTMARCDHLTGALTRRAFSEHADREIERFRRYKTPGSLVLFDLDHFKHLNDTCGHAFGDEVLARTAKVVMDSLRPTDIFGRYGGEEFALLLPGSDEDQALQCAERTRASIAAIEFDRGVRVTASFGVSTTGAPRETLASLLGQADAALYLAKETGRNCCKSASGLLRAA